MAMNVGGKGGIKSDINVTPLVDVVLVLLIIFMVITPMLQRGKDVKLPKVHKQDDSKKSPNEPIIVSITADHSLYLEKDACSHEQFETQLHQKLVVNPSQRIMLKGDESLTFDDVRTVMNLARKAGAKSIALGVEEVAK